MEANKTKIQTIKTQINLVVNTWITRNINWLVKVYDPKSSLDEMPVYTDIEKLKTLKQIIANLPVIVRVPRHFNKLSLPRYYLIFYTDEKIIDIIGIRRDRSPTKWSYRFGFWHPAAQISIASSLQKLLKEL